MARIIDVIMRLQDQVTRPLAQIRNQMEETARVHQRLGKNIRTAGRNMTAIGEALMPVAAGVAGAGSLAVKTFADFDYTITQAGLKAGATAEEMEAMRQTAANVGKDFPITANEAAAAMDRLAASGLNAEQATGALPGIVTAAVASGEDLGNTADVITSALSTYNMLTGDVAANTNKVADIIQMAANRSKLDMTAFGTAMQYAGAPAAALGVDIESLATAMGVMANNGIEASTIGTSLRSTLSRLASPPKQAAEAIQQMGLQTRDAAGNFVGLDNIIDQMRHAMSGMSNTQQVAMAKAIAGEDAYSGLLALIKTAPEDYKNMEDAIRNASGSSKEAYDVMKQTAKGAFYSMTGSVESLAISIGGLLAPTMRQITDVIKGVADWINGLDDSQKQMILRIGEGILAFTAFNMVGGRVISFAGRLIGIYGDVGKVLNGGTIQNKLLMYSVRGLSKVLPAMASGIMTVARALLAAAAAGGPVVWAIMAIVAAAALIYANWDKLAPYFRAIWAEAVNTFNWAYNGISGVIDGIISTLGNIISWVQGVFTSAWSGAWRAVVSIFSGIFSQIEGIASSVLGGIKAAINAVIGGINGISVDIPDWVPGVGGSHLGFNIPMLYAGTPNWRGGPAVIHDRGAEVVDLPSGARVIPHEQSLNQAYRTGAMAGSNRPGNAKISVNIINPQINGQSDIRELARKVAEEIYYQLSKDAVNMNEGAV